MLIRRTLTVRVRSSEIASLFVVGRCRSETAQLSVAGDNMNVR
jgi:hypothetical protein